MYVVYACWLDSINVNKNDASTYYYVIEETSAESTLQSHYDRYSIQRRSIDSHIIYHQSQCKIIKYI